MLMRYKYRATSGGFGKISGNSCWYQCDTEDFKQFWSYAKSNIMWCVVKRDDENFYWYYNCGQWSKLPLTKKYWRD